MFMVCVYVYKIRICRIFSSQLLHITLDSFGPTSQRTRRKFMIENRTLACPWSFNATGSNGAITDGNLLGPGAHDLKWVTFSLYVLLLKLPRQLLHQFVSLPITIIALCSRSMVPLNSFLPTPSCSKALA